MPMKTRIEFYRTRNGDDAHAVLGRVAQEANDLDDAVEIARSLLFSLDMPQWPDAMTISEVGGKELWRCVIDHRTEGKSRAERHPARPGVRVTDMSSHGRSSGKPDQINADTGQDGMDDVYGRRIEADHSWTVYHVFTGVPANIGGHAMVGLGRAAATDAMLAMNLRNPGRYRRRIRLNAPRIDAGEVGVSGWR
jgi:hypothetical protein